MKPEKIIGWVFVFFAVAIIFWTVGESYQIFIGKKSVPQILKPVSPKSYSQSETFFPEEEMSSEMIKEVISEQLSQLFPKEVIFSFLNLIVWLFFTFILFQASVSLAKIGIGLIK